MGSAAAPRPRAAASVIAPQAARASYLATPSLLRNHECNPPSPPPITHPPITATCHPLTGSPRVPTHTHPPPRLQVRMSSRVINQDPPATCHSDVVEAVAAAAGALGLRTKHMVSRAYHDSLFMARCVSVAAPPGGGGGGGVVDTSPNYRNQTRGEGNVG